MKRPPGWIEEYTGPTPAVTSRLVADFFDLTEREQEVAEEAADAAIRVRKAAEAGRSLRGMTTADDVVETLLSASTRDRRIHVLRMAAVLAHEAHGRFTTLNRGDR